MSAAPEPIAGTAVLGDAERCVNCGLCLPMCPTYRLLRTEAESPRGRLALMRALVGGELAPDPKLLAHLDRCLACRACEKVCPSYVPYGRLIVQTRAMLEPRRPRGFWRRSLRTLALDRLVANPRSLRPLAAALRLYQRSGLQRLARAGGVLKLLGLPRLDALLAPLPAQKSLGPLHPASGPKVGQVALFTGCLAQFLDQPTLLASVRLLNVLGYDVHVPAAQTCCGALHLHAGESEKAADLMRRNIRAFPGNLDAVIVTASGCGALLSEYGQYFDASGAERFSNQVKDISQFLLGADWTRTRLRSARQRIAVHDPCTLTNVLRQEKAVYALLKNIPAVDIQPLPDNHLCCGGAGAYQLTHPEIADSLRTEKIEHLRRLAPDVLVTSNLGCALHLAAGVREAGLDIEVVHPVVLLARQLQGARNEIRG